LNSATTASKVKSSAWREESQLAMAAAGGDDSSRATRWANGHRVLICVSRVQVAAPVVLDPVCTAHPLLNQTYALVSAWV
jgi:hypothetical protein